jgi:hypothetical protein
MRFSLPAARAATAESRQFGAFAGERSPAATLKALPAQPSSIVIEITAFWTCGASIGLITGS